MYRISLDGPWQMKRTDRDDWIEASVPGSVYSDLINSGKMDSPYYRDNEYRTLELTKFDYEYRRKFILDDDVLAYEKIVLRCEGIDTLCEIFINEKSAVEANNMHRVYEADIKRLLRPGENTIHAVFRSPVNYALEQDRNFSLASCADAVPGISHIRKAHYMFGWDWGAQLPDMGFWRSVSICGYNCARIGDVSVTQDHFGDHVAVDIRVSLNRWSGEAPGLLVTLESPEGEISQKLVGACGDEEHVGFSVGHPRLWWPNNLGEHPLYNITATLFSGETKLDGKELRIGLRTIHVIREKDKWGESFRFEVNDTAIFCMGANYLPEDHILPLRSRARTEKLLKSCADANFNMLRVWGGGFYPDDYFYDLCDEYGLIVWQDELYACGNYKLSREFTDNIRRETVDNMRRIRHHACLGLWSGNNECEYGWAYWGWPERYGPELQADYTKLFEELLPGISAQEDPATQYWPSSPSSGGAFDDPNDENRGDMHYWSVWHELKPFEEYRKIYSRFMSEFGIQSFPSVKTIETFTLPKDRNIFSHVMESHQKNGTANAKILHYVSENFQYPKDLDSLVYVSQLVQAVGMQCGVEHWRRNRGRCMGSLYWQLNDCWPVASWSSIDYYGRWKAAHYAAKRFFAPVLVSAVGTDTSVTVYANNDTFRKLKGTLSWQLRDAVSDVIRSGNLSVELDAFSAAEIKTLDFSGVLDTLGKKRSAYFEYSLKENGGEISCGNVLFVKPKHFEFHNPDIGTEITEQEDRFTIRLQSRAFADFVKLDFSDADAVFSDNIFHLSAGSPKTVELFKNRLSRKLTLHEVEQKLRVRSLIDTY